MSDSVQPHRWQPTRLRRPWDSPGKNTGVGCHFLLQCMKVKSESEVTQSCPTLSIVAAAKSLQSCPTLCDPIDGSPPGSPVPGILQVRTLEWVAISFSKLLALKHNKNFHCICIFSIYKTVCVLSRLFILFTNNNTYQRSFVTFQ